VIALFFFFAIWPFHAKPAPEPTIQCEKQGELWFYLGADGMIGFSPISCQTAFNNWSTMHVDPIRTSRA
jgi:hypothetical protein